MTHIITRHYVLAGAFLGTGAPIGLVAVRWLRAGVPAPFRFAFGEIAADPLLYGYVGVATVLAFAGFGAVLGILRERVEELSLTDALTRLWNRRHFESQIELEVQRARRYRKPLTLLILDLDRFKNVNDRFGHPEGDRVLRVIAQMIRDSFRKTDIVCRYGGEEIAVIAPETSFAEALGLAERTRERISQTVIPVKGEPFRITVSVGLASLSEESEAAAGDLMREADAALYRAKAEGRNACRGGDRASLMQSRTGEPTARRKSRWSWTLWTGMPARRRIAP